MPALCLHYFPLLLSPHPCWYKYKHHIYIWIYISPYISCLSFHLEIQSQFYTQIWSKLETHKLTLKNDSLLPMKLCQYLCNSLSFHIYLSILRFMRLCKQLFSVIRWLPLKSRRKMHKRKTKTGRREKEGLLSILFTVSVSVSKSLILEAAVLKDLVSFDIPGTSFLRGSRTMWAWFMEWFNGLLGTEYSSEFFTKRKWENGNPWYSVSLQLMSLVVDCDKDLNRASALGTKWQLHFMLQK